MAVTLLPPVSLRDLAAANLQSTERTPGCHVTDITYAIMAKIDPSRFGPGKRTFAEHDSENWQEAGFIWEEMLSRVFALRAAERIATEPGTTRFRPGELTRSGIIGSPDAICLEPDGRVVLEEYKCTWKSSKACDPEGVWLTDKRYLPWHLQIQAYCALAGTTMARLYVLHINGGYDGYIPEVKTWQLSWTQREIDEQWQSLRNTARAAGLLV